MIVCRGAKALKCVTPKAQCLRDQGMLGSIFDLTHPEATNLEDLEFVSGYLVIALRTSPSLNATSQSKPSRTNFPHSEHFPSLEKRKKWNSTTKHSKRHKKVQRQGKEITSLYWCELCEGIVSQICKLIAISAGNKTHLICVDGSKVRLRPWTALAVFLTFSGEKENLCHA